MGTDRAHARWDAVVAGMASAILGAAVAVMLTLSRAPASADLLLPRKPFYPFFEFFIKAQSSAQVRTSLSWTALALTLVGLLLVLRRLWAGLKASQSGALARPGGRPAWLPAVLVLAGGLVFAVLARSTIATLLDLLQNAWFPPESLDIREPALAFVLALVPAYLPFRALMSLARGAFLKAGLWTAASAAIWVAASVLAEGYGARLSLAQSSGTSVGTPGSVFILVLTENEAPDYAVREVPLALPGPVERAEDDLAALERFSRTRSLQRLPALRHAYTGRAALADADRMRASAKAAMEAGDPLAGLLLLGSLSHAPATKDNLGMLESLADEKRWRVGPHAAVLLSASFARFGDAERARYWLSQASQAGSGIPEGLLSPAKAGKPATIRGRFVFEGGEGLRVALYARDRAADRALSADLSAMALSASATLDAKGGFEFRGMPGGDYSLALLLDAPGLDIRVSGHKGDIRMEGKDAVLAPITLRR